MLERRQQSERHDDDDGEHESAQCEVDPKPLRVNIIRIDSDRVQCEGRHRDRGDVPEVEGHRSPVADGDRTPDTRPGGPSPDRTRGSDESERHPGAVQREQ
jgi:hypothetical protein